MKYFEVCVDTYYMNDRSKVLLNELEVIKETETEIQVKNSVTRKKFIKKANLLELKDSNSFSLIIVYAENQKKEAISKLKEELQRQYNYHKSKAKLFKESIEGVVDCIGK